MGSRSVDDVDMTIEAPGSAGRQLAHLHALDRVMAIAEFDPDGVLRQANDNFLRLLGYAREEAIGCHHRRFCSPALIASDGYRAFWPGLRDGRAHVGLAERMRRDGSACWLEATYAPVLDEQGRVQQILKIATDVTVRVERERRQREQLHRLSLVADATDTAVLVSDAESRIVFVNRGFTRMFGWQGSEVEGREPAGLLAPQLDAATIERMRQALRHGQAVGSEEIVAGKNGERYWAKVVANPVNDDSGEWRYTISVLTDITRSKMHEALQQRALEAMAGEQALAEVLELICAEVERIAPEVAAAIVAVEADGRQYLLAAPNLPVNVSCGDAMTGWPGCVATPIRNGQGEVIARFLLFPREPHSGATQVFHQRLVEACTHLCALALERERTRQRIRQLAYYDGLTGLPNRSLLRARAEQAIASAERGQQPLALLFIDLDRFKQVNDSLGHPAGDQLLRHVAMLLQRELRASDVVGRLAGDEFVVVLPSCDVGRATVTLERLQAVLAEPVGIAGRSLMASASVGVAMFPADGRDMDTLLSRADAAMYRAKAEGRGRYAFHAMTPQPAATA